MSPTSAERGIDTCFQLYGLFLSFGRLGPTGILCCPHPGLASGSDSAFREMRNDPLQVTGHDYRNKCMKEEVLTKTVPADILCSCGNSSGVGFAASRPLWTSLTTQGHLLFSRELPLICRSRSAIQSTGALLELALFKNSAELLQTMLKRVGLFLEVSWYFSNVSMHFCRRAH